MNFGTHRNLQHRYFFFFETKTTSKPKFKPYLLPPKSKRSKAISITALLWRAPASNCTVMNDCSMKKLGRSFTTELLCPQLDYLKPREHTDACSLTGSQPEWLGPWWVIALYALCNGIVHFDRAQWWIRLVVVVVTVTGLGVVCWSEDQKMLFYDMNINLTTE